MSSTHQIMKTTQEQLDQAKLEAKCYRMALQCILSGHFHSDGFKCSNVTDGTKECDCGYEFIQNLIEQVIANPEKAFMDTLKCKTPEEYVKLLKDEAKTQKETPVNQSTVGKA